VAQVSVGICVTDEDGRILLWNAAAERITGRLGDITLGNFIWDVYFSLLSPEMKNNNTLDRLQAKFLSFLTSGTSDMRGHKIVHNFIHQNGARFKVLEDVFAVQTAKGHCLFSVLHAEAMRFPVEDALKDSEEKFRNVVEQARDGIVILNAQEEILEWNDGCEQISGIDRKHALDMRLSDVMPQLFQKSGLILAEPEETPHHQTLRYLELIAQTGLSRVIEWAVQHRHGRQKWVQAVIFPIRVSETLLFGVIARDITSITTVNWRHCVRQGWKFLRN
jgi:PAS domain S-box-containing protein